MIFACLLIKGVKPGPFLIVEHPDVFWGVIASMYLGNVMLIVLNLPLVGSGCRCFGALQHSRARGGPIHINRVLQHRQSGLRSLRLDRVRCSWLCAS